ncbi:hypothetical protein [Lacinutrix sp. MedPE-SW]|uniref:hypothetical protein n=1 Tax=Lacinutrix sp. MedPE-SW TaxID=1860087 RepID=UPI000921C98F|nr:hypothetical protein [Lacinutrix sp. MedPE-SW]OIQ23974.1 MAG: hypothetical protein BM549_01305 [Lacinutrix sp. MedPE-SW]
MDHLFNFNIKSNATCSLLSKSIGLTDFNSLSNAIKALPYGRTKNRSDYQAILKENKGTCSTKHAFLKAVALENNQDSVKLFIGIYKMNENNTKGIGSILNTFNLDYIPEAHTYLKVNNNILDITSTQTSNTSFKKDLIKEIEISPNQIGTYKVTLHKDFISKWQKINNKSLSFETLWKIREACIKQLSK